MQILNALIVILVPLIFGLLLLALILRRRADQFYFWEKLALAFPIGLGLMVIIMFILPFVGIPLTFLSIVGTLAVISILIGIYLFKNKIFCVNPNEIKNSLDFDHENMAWWEYGLVILLILKVAYVYFASIVKPLVDIDALKYYSIVAKGIFYKNTLNTPYLSNFMADPKPLFPHLSQGWAFIGLGTINDALFKIIFPTLFLCLMVIFYAVLRRYYFRKPSLIFTFLLSTLPFLVLHVATAYADFTMSFYYGVATLYLFLFIKEFNLSENDKSFPYLFISYVLLVFAVWTKRSGIVLSGVNTFVLATYLITNKNKIVKIDLIKIISIFIVFIVAIFPMITYAQTEVILRVFKQLIGISETAPTIDSANNLLPANKFNIITSIFFRKLFYYADWHLLWGLFVISLILFYKNTFRRPLVLLLAIISLNILIVLVQFGTKEMFQWLIDGTLFDRLMIPYVIVILYFCAEAIIPEWKGNPSAPAAQPSTKSKKGS